MKLRDEITSGNLSVRYSKRFGRLDDFFTDDARWQSMREDFFRRADLPSDPREVPAHLGRRFCPRIRGLHHQRIYRLDANRDYGVLKSLVGRADRTIDPAIIAEQWDRMG